MRNGLVTKVALGLSIAASFLLPASVASASTSTTPSVQLASSISSQLPLLRLTFNAPISTTSLPSLVIAPVLTTSWSQIAPNEVEALVTGTITPGITYTVSVPTSYRCAATCTVNASASKVLSSTTNYGYINQLLAELNYLPFSFTPTTPTSDTSTQTPGTFSPRFSIPLTTKTFNANVANVITRGALMTFQSQNNLRATGTVTVNTYLDLLHAVSINKLDPQPYNYVYVTDRSYNETLVLYKNGVAWSPIAVNTGISLTPTSPGTYPVYLRFRSTTMRGTNPNGTKYDDPDIQWVSYFNGGEGLHEFPRYSYGFPQSLGCVEMSMANAARVWPNTPIGTLVTVYEPA